MVQINSSSKLTLGELRTLTSFLQTVLLALNHTSIARKEASLLQLGAIFASLKKRTGDAMTQSTCLTGNATAVDAGNDIEVINGVGNLERGQSHVQKSFATEVLLAIATVNGNLTSARNKANTSDSVLTTTGAVIQCFTCHD